jgi:hypothetical protein
VRPTQFSIWQGILPPLVNLLLLACHHHKHPISLTLQVSNMLPANDFNARPIMTVVHSVFHLAGKYPYPLSTSCYQPVTIQTPHQSHLWLPRMLPANDFNARPIMTVARLVFHLAGEYLHHSSMRHPCRNIVISYG